MNVNRYRLKGILISLVFILLVAVLGIDLGRLFWIALVLLLAVAAIAFPIWIARKASKRSR